MLSSSSHLRPGPEYLENQIRGVKDLSIIPEDDDMEGGSLYSGIECQEDKDSCVSSLLEQSLDMNSDIEQMEALEVANLLQEIERLQMHQIRERKELIRRHQLQLQSLDAENLEKQMMFAQQRQFSCGVTQPVSKTVSGFQNIPNSVPTSNALPRVTTEAPSVLSKKESVSLDALSRLHSLGVLPVLVQKGRPLPTFHDDVHDSAEDEEIEDYYVDNKNDSVESTSHMDGISPLPDSGSELSEIPNKKAFSKSEVSACHVRQNPKLQDNQFFRLNSNEDRRIDRNFEGINSEELTRYLKSTNLATVSNSNKNNGFVGMLRSGTTLSLQQPDNVMDGHVRDNGSLNTRTAVNANIISNLAGVFKTGNGGVINETEKAEHQSETVCNQEEVLNDKLIKQDVNFDEQPVYGIGNRKKTFEELLEEELLKEQQLQSDNSTKTVHKRSFLRKREGLAKFQKQSTSESLQSVNHSNPMASKPRKTLSNANLVKKSVMAKGKLFKTDEVHVPSATFQLKRPLPPASSVATGGAAPEENFWKSGRPSVSGAGLQTKLVPLDRGKSGQSIQPLNSKVNLPAGNHSKLSHSQTDSQSKPASFSSSTALKLTSAVTQASVNNAKTPVLVSSASLRPAEITTKVVTVSTDAICDTSFLACLEKCAEREKVESEELQEFELLERYADDNASFLSNVSSVDRVLAHHKQSLRNQTVAETRKTEKLSSVAREEESHSCDEASDNTSTVSSSDDATIDESDSEDANDGSDLNATLKEKAVQSENPISADKIRDNCMPQTVVRKIASVKRDNADNQPANFSNSDDDDDDDDDDDSDDVDDDVDRGAVDQLTSSLKLIKESEPMSSNGNRQKRNDTKNSVALEERVAPVKTQTLGQQSSSNVVLKDRRVNDFEDENSWEDAYSPQVIRGKENDPHKSTSGQNHSSLRAVDQSDLALELIPPPTSQLVSKLFPKLKPDPPKSKLPTQPEQKPVEIGDGVQSKLLREKIAEMENEIQKFRNQNATLEKLRKEREDGLATLKKEMAEFEKEKQEELNRLQEFKALEMKKLKKERKVFEQYQKSLRELPNKKEREEIESLKSQLSKLQEDVQKKEQRWTSSTSRLRDRIELLERENEELKDENRLLEQRRLEMQQSKKSVDNFAVPATSRKPQQLERDINKVSAVPSAGNLPSKIGQNHSEQVSQFDGSTELVQTQTSSSSKTSTVAPGSGQNAAFSGRRHPPNVMKANASDDNRPSMTHLPQTSDALTPRSSNSPSLCPDYHENYTDAPKVVTRKTASLLSNNITNSLDKGDNRYEEVKHPDGKVERVFSNGMREIHFSNGTWKQVSSDGQSVIVFFFNGDIKRILPDKKIVYYYADTQTTHTTYPDGLEVCEFPNQYIEKSYPDGTKEILLSDGTIRYIFPSGVEESVYRDGTNIRVEKNGDMIKEFANGQREILTEAYKRREFPDGTVKTVFPDGRQETRYSSGRLRVKDKSGNVLVDKQMPKVVDM